MNKVALTLMCLATLASAKEQPIKFSTITDTTDPASAEMIKLFRQRLERHPNLFELVDSKDLSLGLLFTADCMPRQNAGDQYVCFYTMSYAGGSSKTFMGGGVYAANSAALVADAFLSSVAQDIVERLNKIVRTNAIETLESCLFLTQSTCAVPEPLAPELKVKIINLSQYMQRGGLNK